MDVLARSSIRLVMLCWLCVAPGARAQEQAPFEPAKPVEELAVVKAPKAAKAKPMASKPASHNPTSRKSTAHTATSNRALPRSGAQDPVAFNNAPFPYDGKIPGAEPGEQATSFFNVDPDGRRFHIAPRGGKLYEDKTYSDKRTLLFIPSRFDPSKHAAIVLFLHGNLAILERDVVQRQRVPAQLQASGFNAVLVAPQLAVDALDSSAGRFWDPRFFDLYLAEAAEKLAAKSAGRFTAEQVQAWPVVIVAYSGGYLATAYTLNVARNAERIKGVILLDALFGEEPKFANWIEQARQTAFFVSAYSDASKSLNAQLMKTLGNKQTDFVRQIPPSIRVGDVVFQAAPAAVHNDFVTQAWEKSPLQGLFRRIDLGAPRPSPETSTAGADPDPQAVDPIPRSARPKQKAAKSAKKAPPAILPVSPPLSECPADDPKCKQEKQKRR